MHFFDYHGCYQTTTDTCRNLDKQRLSLGLVENITTSFQAHLDCRNWHWQATEHDCLAGRDEAVYSGGKGSSRSIDKT